MNNELLPGQHAKLSAPPTPIWLLLGLVLGTAFQLQQATLAADSFYAAGLAAGLVGLVLGIFRWPQSIQLPRLLVMVLAGMALGFSLTGLRAAAFDAQALNPALEGRDIQVTGVVQAMPRQGEDAVRFRLKVESAWLEGQPVVLPPQLYLGWYAGFFMAPRPTAPADAESLTLLQLQRQPQPMRAGERWQMTVRLKAPHGSSNPHAFDYELWLWEQGLQATGSVRAGVRDTPPEKLSDQASHNPRYAVERARQSVREAIFERIDSSQRAGVLAALVLGDQNAIERADWDVFRATGISHLVSISGLHITLFAWLASRVLGWLWGRSALLTPRLCLWLPASSAAAWGGLLMATTYAVFSGLGLPAQRTILMLAVVVLLRQSGRQWAWPHIWLLAMAVVVAFDPWALLQAGFWLSFVAVGVLFASDPGTPLPPQATAVSAAALRSARWRWLPYLQAWLLHVAGGFWRMLRQQWVITLALTPLTLLLFNQVSVVGLLANILAIPAVTLLITPLALLGVAWSPLWDLAAWLIGVLMSVLEVLAAWPMATLSQAAVPVWCAAAGVVGGLLLVMRLPWHWRVLGVPLLLPVLLWQPLLPEIGQFEVLAADIGQGNSVLVRTANHALLYDAGPRFSRDSDAGDRVLVPLLRALGERLDLVLLSHRDADHVGGAASVLAMQPQAGLSSSMDADHELQQLRLGTRCATGQRWQWDGVDFEMLHPDPVAYDAPARSNTMSCVLRISSASRVSALLVGDIEVRQEQSLLRAGSIQSDLLLMPHHGSKTSSSASFLDAVQPQLALAQAGYRNRFNHPAPEVLGRYRERNITVLQSAHCGAATWRSVQPADWTCEREKERHYWHHRVPGAAPALRP
ncbi:MAG: DNA internalization-related competence protein ComEC/Rec2 [Polaromonas sp.]|nr:DNA internalization-related competence protein ComEC/Rec2 [Polaromonas sp.]